jgi:hypothetical protein
MARLFAAALLLAACAAPTAPDPWRLATLDALEARHDAAIVEPGAGLTLLQSPYPALGSRSGVQQAERRGLTIFPAFSEGKPAAYMTTEVWQNFDQVWVQPLYVDSTRSNKPIFGIDATSRFYSPYWQVFLYALPPGKEFRTAKDVLDARVDLVPNTAKFCAITRDSALAAAQQQGDAAPIRPLTGETVTAPKNGSAYAEGNEVSFVDLGNAQRFTFDPRTLVVEETPLYAFALPDASGNPQQVDLPRVGGTGPPHRPRCNGQGACTGVVGGVPQFGSLWRVYNVFLPPAADVYVPAALPELQQKVRAMGFAAPQTAAPLAPEFTLRVAANGKTCLAGNPAACVWLDAQNQIESQVVEWRVTKTGTLVTCPLVLFNGAAVPFR